MMLSDTRYFITGGAGFIGSHLIDRLVRTGLVTAYDNLSSGKLEFIRHHLNRDNFNFIQSDLLDFDTLRKAISGHDVVFHLAANPEIRTGISATDLDLKTGTLATYNTLEAMRVNQIRKIIFTSSPTIYGDAGLRQVNEEYGPLLPISLYAASKLGSEGLISAYCHLFDIQGVIFRLANVVGSRLTHGVILDFINKLKQNPKELEILGDGKQEKPYLHIKDCIDGMLLGLEDSNEPVNAFNLGSSSSTGVITIANMVIEAMRLGKVEFKYTGGSRGWPGDIPQVRLDIAKISQLGWSPRYSSDEAVGKAINDILGNHP